MAFSTIDHAIIDRWSFTDCGFISPPIQSNMSRVQDLPSAFFFLSICIYSTCFSVAIAITALGNNSWKILTQFSFDIQQLSSSPKDLPPSFGNDATPCEFLRPNSRTHSCLRLRLRLCRCPSKHLTPNANEPLRLSVDLWMPEGWPIPASICHIPHLMWVVVKMFWVIKRKLSVLVCTLQPLDSPWLLFYIRIELGWAGVGFILVSR